MLALIVGIVLMIADNRAPGETIIAIASLFYAAATKIKYYSKRRKHRGKSIIESLKELASRIAPWRGDKDSYMGDGNSLRSPVHHLPETGSPTDHDGCEPE
jgi:hypothetical protein